ncbi:hypothetical protein FACS189416_1260 [Bacteroidia bacterium]|nr:hypothetical protein FACS189416_1260 [Bacteroidia bacterium]
MTALLWTSYSYGQGSVITGTSLSWTLTPDSVLTVSGVGAIPDYNNDAPWTADRAKIREVVIENGVTAIGNEAFRECSNLESVSIGNTVTRIGRRAFTLCSNLEAITIPSGVAEIEAEAFYNCNRLAAIEVDAASTYYASTGGVLYNKDKTHLHTYPMGKSGTAFGIPGTVTSIEAYAFANCNSLTDIYVRNTALTLGANAFVNVNLASRTLHIPSGAGAAYQSAPWSTFGTKKEYQYATNGGLDWSLEDGKLIVSGTGIIYGFPWLWENRQSIFTLVIEEGVTGIGNSVFSSFNNLTSVTISNTVANIGASAFAYCTHLTSIGVDAASAYFSLLDGVLYNKAQSTLVAYPHGKSGKTFTIPASVTIIEAGAFSSDNLTSIVIPEGVTKIREQAFYGCRSLNSITIPASVDSIGGYALACYNLSDVIVKWTTPLPIAPDVFEGIGVITLYIPTGTKPAYLAADVWKDFKIAELASGTIGSIEWTLNGETLTVSGTGAIPNNNNPWGTGITKLIIEEGITGIGAQAFAGNINLADVIVYWTTPANVAPDAFDNVAATAKLHVPTAATGAYGSASVWNGFTIVGYEASGKAGQLNWILEGNTLTISGVGAIPNYSYETQPWYNYRDRMQAVIIDEGVTSIGNQAFVQFHSIQSVKIPSTVTSIGVSAFRNCLGLISVNIPASVTNIEYGNFEACQYLMSIDVASDNPAYYSENGVFYNKNKTILYVYPARKTETEFTIPSTVTVIRDYTFWIASNLTSVTIPNTIMRIGSNAFYRSGLTSVTIPSSVTFIESSAFAGCTSLPSIDVDLLNPAYVAEDGVLYNKTKRLLHTYPAGKTGEVFPIPSFVTKIGDYAFAYNQHLSSATITMKVDSIGYDAFWNSNIDSVHIPASVTYIGGGAFSSCRNLTSITTDLASPYFYSRDSILYNKDITRLYTYPSGKRDTAYTIPSSVTYTESFTNEYLTSIVIPSSVTSLGQVYSPYLSDVTVRWTTPLPIYEYTFPRLDQYGVNTRTLHIPAGSLSAYQAAPYWGDTNYFTSYKEEENSVVAEEAVPVVSGNEGHIELSLTIPTGATLTGSFHVTFPEGMKLDTINTRLSPSLADAFALKFTHDSIADVWTIEIIVKPAATRALSLRSAGEYIKIMDIAYIVDEDVVTDGNYTIRLSDIDFTLSDNTTIQEASLDVNVQVQRTEPGILAASSPALAFAAAGGAQTVTVTSNLDWTASSDAAWLTVSPASGNSNGTVTATANANSSTSARTAIITLTAEGVTPVKINVTQAGAITDPTNPAIYVTGVSLNHTTLAGKAGDDAVELIATITPTNATNRDVNWSTSNPLVATVDADGKVNFIGAGKATITVTTVDGAYTADCVVTVSTITDTEGIDAALKVYFQGNTLYVSSPAAETIEVYSFSGTKLFSARKNAGDATFTVPTNQKAVIVRGSSGWTKKTGNN